MPVKCHDHFAKNYQRKNTNQLLSSRAKPVYKPKAGNFLELSEAWRIQHFSLFCTSCVVSVVTQRCSLLGNCDLIDNTKKN